MDEWNLWMSGSMEQAFFSKAPEPKAGAKPKRKPNANRPLYRKRAHMELKALDGNLRSILGAGLELFDAAADPVQLGTLPRTLVLHTDEASTNVAMACWLLCKSGLRVMYTRDPFHRAWNDCKNSLIQAGQYWVALLCRVVFNLPYGPYDGRAWWEKLSQQANDMEGILPVGGPIWREFYPLVCKDHGCFPPSWAPGHMQAMLQVVASTCAGAKGGRMAMNRWFGYLQCIPQHQNHWHSRCLLVLLIGMRAGLYRDHLEFALWGGPTAKSAQQRSRRTRRRRKPLLRMSLEPLGLRPQHRRRTPRDRSQAASRTFNSCGRHARTTSILQGPLHPTSEWSSWPGCTSRSWSPSLPPTRRMPVCRDPRWSR